MKKFIGTKIIEAEPMTHGDYAERNGVKLVHRIAEDAGYLVRYEDDYESQSPAEVFKEAYREFTNLSFGHAIELLKRGYKLARAGWNSNKQYIPGGASVASGFASHAEGTSTEAIGSASHAEGVYTRSPGEGAHSEGMYHVD